MAYFSHPGSTVLSRSLLDTRKVLFFVAFFWCLFGAFVSALFGAFVLLKTYGWTLDVIFGSTVAYAPIGAFVGVLFGTLFGLITSFFMLTIRVKRIRMQQIRMQQRREEIREEIV